MDVRLDQTDDIRGCAVMRRYCLIELHKRTLSEEGEGLVEIRDLFENQIDGAISEHDGRPKRSAQHPKRTKTSLQASPLDPIFSLVQSLQNVGAGEIEMELLPWRKRFKY